MRWLVCSLVLMSTGCVGCGLQKIVTTLDRAHIPSCIRAHYELRLGVTGDEILVVYAAAGGADLAACLALLQERLLQDRQHN